MRTAMFRNIIWDVDGTLFDTYPAITKAFQAALHDLGKEAALDWVEGLAKISLSHCVATLADHYHLKEEEVGDAFEKYYDQVTPKDQPPFPGVIAICAYICASGGKNVIVTHRGHAGTHELLAAHNMTHYFAGCLAREDGYPRKPHPAAFEAAIKIHNLPKAGSMTVGDRGIDILAGKAAGIFTCLFGPEADEAMADLTITGFDELYGFLTSESSSLPAVF
jgi:phosphoglycolate phosphatase-like HAD superfamily hydrolase